MFKTWTIIYLVFSTIFLPLTGGAETMPIKKTEEYKTKIPYTIVERISLPKGYHEGLHFDGKNIWVANGKKIETWIIDVSAGEKISDIQAPGTFTEGITTSKDGAYWVTDWDSKKLYKVRIENGKMIPEKEISVGSAHPAGVVYVNGKFYIVLWDRGMGTRYYLLEIDEEGTILRKIRIKGIHEPAHLTWDGESIWLTSWFSSLVYKINLDSLKIEGSFRAPASAATGIIWDGTYLWITGTSADLYKIKLETSNSE